MLRAGNFRGCLLAVPAVLYLIVFFVVPLLLVVQVSFWERGPRGTVIHEYTTEHYEYVDNTYRPILERSLKIAGQTTAYCLLLGFPLAFFISTRKRNWVRQLSLFLVILPFWTNFLIRTYAWRVLLGADGIINNYFQEWGLINEPLEILYTPKAVIIGMVYGFLPFMVLPIYASLERFDFKLVEAAKDLGANDWSAFWRVILPMTLPGVVAGIILVFVPAVGAFVTPDLLGGVQGLMIGNLINLSFTRRNMPRGAATSIVLMGIVAIGLVVYILVTRRSSSRSTRQSDQSQNPFLRSWNMMIETLGRIQRAPFELIEDTTSAVIRRLPITDGMRVVRDRAVEIIGRLIGLIAPIINYLFLWLPIAILVLFSFNNSRSTGVWRGASMRWYEKILDSVARNKDDFSTELMIETLQNSLIVSITATIIAAILGTMVAMSLVRGRYPGKSILTGLLFLPVAIPEIAQAFSLYIFFNLAFDWIADSVLITDAINGFNNLFGTSLQPGFGYTTIILSHVAFNISFVAIVVQARLVDMNPRFEEAARDLGANEWRTFWRVTFPLLLPAIVAGALLAFTLSLDDFVVTFMTTGIGTTTLTVYVYGLLKQTVTPEINAVSTLMILASTLLVGISLVLQGRNASRV